MNIKVHIFIIFSLLIIQFFIVDIFALVYLPFVEHKNSKKEFFDQFYRKGEYKPVSNEGPNDYVYAIVDETDHEITETFYTKEGNRIIVKHVRGKWKSTESNFLPVQAYFVLPLIAFGLAMFAILHKSFRTGAITTWGLSKYPFDNLEKMCLLYAIPIFLSGILFGWLGRS